MLLLILIKNDENLLSKSGFLENHINRFCLEFKITLKEQNEEYLDHTKNEDESIIEKILDEKMEAYFATMIEDVRHERSLILVLSLTDPDTLKQSKFTDHEKNKIKNFAFENLHR